MRILLSLIVAVGVYLSIGATARAADLAIYGHLPLIEGAAVSADGKTVAVARSDGTSRTIELIDAETSKSLVAISAGKMKVRGLKWIDSENLLILTTVHSYLPGTAASVREWMLGALYNTRTRVQRPLLSGKVDFNILLGPPETRVIDGQSKIFAESISFAERNKPTVVTLIMVDPATGTETVVERAAADVERMLVGPDGKIVAYITRSISDRLPALSLVPGKTKLPSNATGGVNLAGLGRTPGTALVSYTASNVSKLAEVNLQTGDWSDCRGG